MERIERMSGPLVLRVRHQTGIVSYWNWDAINRFQFDAEIGGFFFKDGSFHRLSPAEYRQVQEQLDILIDPPTSRVNVKKQERESDLWAGHPFIAKPEEE